MACVGLCGLGKAEDHGGHGCATDLGSRTHLCLRSSLFPQVAQQQIRSCVYQAGSLFGPRASSQDPGFLQGPWP